MIILDQSELNIYRLNQKINSKKIRLYLEIFRIKFGLNIIEDQELIIFSLKRYKHVKYLENNIYSAIKNNIFGTLNLLESIKHKKVHLLLFLQIKLLTLKLF